MAGVKLISPLQILPRISQSFIFIYSAVNNSPSLEPKSTKMTPQAPTEIETRLFINGQVSGPVQQFNRWSDQISFAQLQMQLHSL